MGIDPLSSAAAMRLHSADVGERVWEKTREAVMAGEMTAGEVRMRMEGRLPPGMPDFEIQRRMESMPRWVMQSLGPGEVFNMLRMGMPFREIEIRAERMDREGRRRREMMINPPGMWMDEAAEIDPRVMERLSRDMLGTFTEEPKSKFPEYSEEKFSNMGKEPVVKEIMTGAVKLTKKQRLERIKLHLEK